MVRNAASVHAYVLFLISVDSILLSASHATELHREKVRAAVKDEKPLPREEKEIEDPIDVMRGELCWARHFLIEHDDCMAWLVKECTGKYFGTGLCRRVTEEVKEHCLKGHQKACEYAKRLNIDLPKESRQGTVDNRKNKKASKEGDPDAATSGGNQTANDETATAGDTATAGNDSTAGGANPKSEATKDHRADPGSAADEDSHADHGDSHAASGEPPLWKEPGSTRDGRGGHGGGKDRSQQSGARPFQIHRSLAMLAFVVASVL